MAKEVVVRPGVAVRTMLADLIKNDKVTDEVLATMVDKEASAKAFGIRYALLKEINADEDLKAQLVVYGKPRYGVKTIEFKGKNYAVTNDIYKQNVPKFQEFVEGLGK